MEEEGITTPRRTSERIRTRNSMSPSCKKAAPGVEMELTECVGMLLQDGRSGNLSVQAGEFGDSFTAASTTPPRNSRKSIGMDFTECVGNLLSAASGDTSKNGVSSSGYSRKSMAMEFTECVGDLLDQAASKERSARSYRRSSVMEFTECVGKVVQEAADTRDSREVKANENKENDDMELTAPLPSFHAPSRKSLAMEMTECVGKVLSSAVAVESAEDEDSMELTSTIPFSQSFLYNRSTGMDFTECVGDKLQNTVNIDNMGSITSSLQSQQPPSTPGQPSFGCNVPVPHFVDASSTAMPMTPASVAVVNANAVLTMSQRKEGPLFERVHALSRDTSILDSARKIKEELSHNADTSLTTINLREQMEKINRLKARRSVAMDMTECLGKIYSDEDDKIDTSFALSAPKSNSGTQVSLSTSAPSLSSSLSILPPPPPPSSSSASFSSMTLSIAPPSNAPTVATISSNYKPAVVATSRSSNQTLVDLDMDDDITLSNTSTMEQYKKSLLANLVPITPAVLPPIGTATKEKKDFDHSLPAAMTNETSSAALLMSTMAPPSLPTPIMPVAPTTAPGIATTASTMITAPTTSGVNGGTFTSTTDGPDHKRLNATEAYTFTPATTTHTLITPLAPIPMASLTGVAAASEDSASFTSLPKVQTSQITAPANAVVDSSVGTHPLLVLDAPAVVSALASVGDVDQTTSARPPVEPMQPTGSISFSEFLSMAGINFYDQCARRRPTMAMGGQIPETLRDFLRISWMIPQLKTYDWGQEHLTSLLNELRSRPALSTAPLVNNSLVESLVNADEEGLAVIQSSLGQLKGHCRARAKTRWHEWRSKVESVVLQSLEEYHKALNTEHVSVNEHLARIQRHREAMAGRSAHLKEELRRIRDSILDQQQRAQVIKAIEKNKVLKAKEETATTLAKELSDSLTAAKDMLQLIQSKRDSLTQEYAQLQRSLTQATVKVSTEHLFQQGLIFDAACATVAWRPRIIAPQVIEFHFPGLTARVLFHVTTQGEGLYAIDDIKISMVAAEASSLQVDKSKYSSLREVGGKII